MNVEKEITVINNYINNIVWGSIDPVTSDIALYSTTNSNEIEEQYSQNADTITLNIFSGVNILFNNNKPYQITGSGYRSVFREVLDESKIIKRKIEKNNFYNAWYLADQKTIRIGLLVDTSGSMRSIYKNVIEQALEEFIEKQKESENDVKFYGSTFANNIVNLYNDINLKTETDIKDTFYNINPGGSTAYYDSVKTIINNIDIHYNINDEVTLCIVTDGADNCSSVSLNEMKQIIEDKKSIGWNIIMIGTNNYDAENICEQQGFSRNSAMNIGNNVDNIRETFRGISNGVQRVRGGQDSEVTFNIQERNLSR
jgi:hypothetical protein